MSVQTKLFTDEDLEEALTLFEDFCSDEEIDPEDIISVNIVSRHADKESSVVLVYDDCTAVD